MKKIYSIFILLLSIICISNVEAKLVTKDVKGTYCYDEAFKQLEQLNQEREKVGVAPLKMDTELFEAAQTRAAEISLVFSHTRPSGKSWTTVSTKAWGENILYDTRAGAKYATDGWMNSEGHRKNMLNSSFKSVGIACFKYQNAYNWVQIFNYDDTDEQITTAPKNETKTVAVVLSEIPDKVEFDSDIYYIDKVGDSITINFHKTPENINANSQVYSLNDLIDLEYVNGSLKVTAKSEGYEQIKLSYSDDVYAIATIIIGKKQESISLEKDYYEVEIGNYLELNPTITPSDAIKNYFLRAKEPEYFDRVTSNGQAVRLYAAKIGTTEISVTTADGKHSFNATIKIVPSSTINSVSIDKTNVKLAKGSSTTLTAIINPSETMADKTITWSSSDTSIATVDKSGVVTAIGVGTTTITAKTSNGLVALATITVDKVNIKNLKIDNITNQIYTNKSLKPKLKIMDNDKELVLNKDYKVSYKNNKNIGTATINITGIGEYTGSISKTFKIVVGTPKNIAWSKQDKSSITIKWSKPSGNITGYEIYYSTKKDSGFKKVTTLTKTSYKKTKLSAGKTYYFKVRAYKTVSGKKKYSSYTNVLQTTTAPKSPSIKLASNTSAIKVSYKKVSGATGYEVYQSTDKKNYTKIATTNELSYKVENLSSAKTYYYKVRAYKIINSKKINSTYSKVISITTKPFSPEVEYKPGKKSITLSWNKISRVSGYQIGYKVKETKSWKYVTTNKLTKNLTKLTSKKEYELKVRAYKTVSGKKIYSSWSTINIVKVY